MALTYDEKKALFLEARGAMGQVHRILLSNDDRDTIVTLLDQRCHEIYQCMLKLEADLLQQPKTT